MFIIIGTDVPGNIYNNHVVGNVTYLIRVSVSILPCKNLNNVLMAFYCHFPKTQIFMFHKVV